MDKFVYRIGKKINESSESSPRNVDLNLPDTPNSGNSIGAACISGCRTNKTGRSFQKHWIKKYQWLSYNEDVNKVFCSVCKDITSRGISIPKKSSRDEESIKIFTQVGFSSWNKALERFSVHENSEVHKFCSLQRAHLDKGTNVHSMISKGKEADMKSARVALLKMISSLRFLMVGGLAIRGHDDHNSNYHRLLDLISEDNAELSSWLKRTKYRWISHEVTNELCSVIANEVLKIIINLVKDAHYYSIMLDESSDISNHEQVSVCFRFVNSEDLQVREIFCGFYETQSTSAETLFKLCKDVLTRFSFDIKMCRGVATDGAANMSGTFSGLQARIKAVEPRAIHIHCLAHSLNLVVQDSMKQVSVIRDYLVTIRELITFVRGSPKRQAKFETFQAADDNPSNATLRPFCPTRWCCRISSLKTVVSNYGDLIAFFADMELEKTEAGAKAKGFLKSLYAFDFAFITKLLIDIFERIEVLNTFLQNSSMHIQQALENVENVRKMLESLRTNEAFNLIWNSCREFARQNDIDEPKLPQVRRKPKRFGFDVDEGNNEHIFSNPNDFYRKMYFEVLDLVINCFQDRFNKTSITHLQNIESFIVNKSDNGDYLIEFYKDDFDRDRLILHRNMLLDICNSKSIFLKNLGDAVSFLSVPEHESIKELIPEIVKLIKMMLTIPISTCTAERSFSSLRRLKTYLRNNMTQRRLNDIAILHVNRDLAQEISLESVADIFIKRTAARRNTFILNNID